MGRRDQVLQLGVGTEVRIDMGEVSDPVAVVARALTAGRALHRLVDEGRRQPDRGGAKSLDVSELAGQADEVPAVVEAFVRRVKPGCQLSAGEAAEVVGLASVGE